MQFTDKEITWACQRVLLDQLESSKVIRESLSHNETSNFRDFIKGLKLEEINRIFEAPWKPLSDDDFIDPITKKDSHDSGVRKLTIGPPTIDLKPNRKGEYEETVKSSLSRKFGLGRIAIGVGLATLLAVIGYLLYRKYKDKCRQICSKSVSKDMCMRKCKVENIRTIIEVLNTEKSKCGKNKKCIIKFERKIRDWGEKLRSIK